MSIKLRPSIRSKQMKLVFVISLILLTGIGCYALEEESVMPTNTAAPQSDVPKADPVTLETQAEIKDNQLVIHYQIKNETDGAIYLTNRVFQWTPEGLSVDANLIYTELIDGKLRLTKANIPVPDHIKVESPDVPYLTELEAGGQFDETIVQPLPLKAYHPYNLVKSSADTHTFDQVEFVVGWLPATVTVRTTNPTAALTLLSASYGDVNQEQTLLISDLALSIPAMIEAAD
jgi:hypothetical protein